MFICMAQVAFLYLLFWFLFWKASQFPILKITKVQNCNYFGSGQFVYIKTFNCLIEAISLDFLQSIKKKRQNQLWYILLFCAYILWQNGF